MLCVVNELSQYLFYKYIDANVNIKKEEIPFQNTSHLVGFLIYIWCRFSQSHALKYIPYALTTNSSSFDVDEIFSSATEISSE